MSSSTEQSAIQRLIRVSGLLFSGFGLSAILFRISQFLILGDPPLEILVLQKQFLPLQGIPSLVVAAFFLIGATALYLHQAQELGWLGLAIYLFAFSMLVLSSGAMWTYAFTAPALARDIPELLTAPSSGIIQAVFLSMALGQIGWLSLVLVSFKSKKINRSVLFASAISSILGMALAPFADTQLLRLLFNLLLGTGPLILGIVLWKDG